MTELEIISAVLGGLAVLGVVLGFAALRAGMVEGSLTIRIVGLRKRKPEAAIEATPGGEAGT
jgi:hypothetical protein